MSCTVRHSRAVYGTVLGSKHKLDSVKPSSRHDCSADIPHSISSSSSSSTHCGFFGRYDCSADIWSLGITLLEFALGQAPLQNCNLDQILMKTLNEPPPILESADRRKRFTEVRQQQWTKYHMHVHLLQSPTKKQLQPGLVLPSWPQLRMVQHMLSLRAGASIRMWLCAWCAM